MSLFLFFMVRAGAFVVFIVGFFFFFVVGSSAR
jgi:hypothetical protein